VSLRAMPQCPLTPLSAPCLSLCAVCYLQILIITSLQQESTMSMPSTFSEIVIGAAVAGVAGVVGYRMTRVRVCVYVHI
jgi:hypothetical protein